MGGYLLAVGDTQPDDPAFLRLALDADIFGSSFTWRDGGGQLSVVVEREERRRGGRLTRHQGLFLWLRRGGLFGHV